MCAQDEQHTGVTGEHLDKEQPTELPDSRAAESVQAGPSSGVCGSGIGQVRRSLEPTSPAQTKEPAQTADSHSPPPCKKLKLLQKTLSSPGSLASFHSKGSRGSRGSRGSKASAPVPTLFSVPEFGESAPPHECILEELQVPNSFDDNGASNTSTSSACSSEVRSIDDAMSWPANHTRAMLKHLSEHHREYCDDLGSSDSDAEVDGQPSQSLRRMLKAFDSVPMSTAFSGIDAPSTGLCQQIFELNSRVSSPIQKPIHLNAVEWFSPSQTELLCHPCRPRCLFSDITCFLTPYLRGIFPALVKNGKMMEILKPIISNPESITLCKSQSYQFFTVLHY